MKDNKILLLIPLIGIFFILTGIVIYDNYATNKANEKLKKEKYEIKLKCEKLEEEQLKRIIKGE